MEEQAQSIQAELTNRIHKIEFALENISSPVLARLIEEVKNNEQSTTHGYDRVHNRHNR